MFLHKFPAKALCRRARVRVEVRVLISHADLTATLQVGLRDYHNSPFVVVNVGGKICVASLVFEFSLHLLVRSQATFVTSTAVRVYIL